MAYWLATPTADDAQCDVHSLANELQLTNAKITKGYNNKN